MNKTKKRRIIRKQKDNWFGENNSMPSTLIQRKYLWISLTFYMNIEDINYLIQKVHYNMP